MPHLCLVLFWTRKIHARRKQDKSEARQVRGILLSLNEMTIPLIRESKSAKRKRKQVF